MNLLLKTTIPHAQSRNNASRITHRALMGAGFFILWLHEACLCIDWNSLCPCCSISEYAYNRTSCSPGMSSRAYKVYWTTRDRPWSVFLDDAMYAEFPSDKPQHSEWFSSASTYTWQNCGLAGYLLQLPGLSRSKWPRGPWRKSAAARLLRLWVQILPGAWMSVCCECCVLSGRALCDELITCPDESNRLWCVVVCDLETSWMRMHWPTGGLSRQKKKCYRISWFVTQRITSPLTAMHSVWLL